MRGAVDIDRDSPSAFPALLFVEEIGTRTELFEKPLGVGRQVPSFAIRQFEPALFELRPAPVAELLVPFLRGTLRRLRLDASAPKRLQDVLNQEPIQLLVVALIRVAQQTVVARKLALLSAPDVVSLVLPRLAVEMTKRQSFRDQRVELRATAEDLTQNPRAPFGAFVEEEEFPILLARERLRL